MDTQTINRAKQLIEVHGFDVVFSHIESEMKKAKSPDEYKVFLKRLIHSYESDAAALGVHIESPFALSEESVEQIKKSLDAANSSHTFTINKSLLGGFVATHNYQKIDASLQSALKRLEV
jgi:F0F1-type ATP synthase delta subunit